MGKCSFQLFESARPSFVSVRTCISGEPGSLTDEADIFRELE
jgi:hypothetical protein